MPSVPDGLKQQLHAAIADIAAVRGGYVGDLRTYTRNRKLTTFDIISLLIGWYKISIAPEAYRKPRKLCLFLL